MRVLLVLALLFGSSLAQNAKQAAIDIAAQHPALSTLLASHKGWTADAYNTGTTYGVWRVQFFFPSGEDLGWADVSPKLSEVFAWEADYRLTGEQDRQAQRTLYRFVRQNQKIRSLLGDTAEVDKWFWYDSWREGWFVHLERGADSLDVSIRSHSKGPLKLSNLFIEKIYLSNVLSYSDYQQARRSSAVALAFAEPDIAAALRDKPGWTSQSEQGRDGHWRVRFFAGETLLVSAEVDLEAAQVHVHEIR